jgi:hypothetical protein
MDGFAGRRARTIDRPAPAPAGEQVAALSAAGSTPPRAVIDKLDLRIGRRYRVVHHAPDGRQFAVRGAYLEIDCPHSTRTRSSRGPDSRTPEHP